MSLLWLVALLVLAALVWVRVAPTDPGRWHVDPAAAPPPGPAGVLVRGDAGAIPAPVLDRPPRALLEELDAIIRAGPRTRPIAGSVAEGRITYVTRSRWIGFPDYTTVAAEPAGTGARPVILARLRFGRSDLGVNRARVERWLDELAPG